MAVSELPGNPNAVWTVKASSSEDYDAFIVVSFLNATLVLSIGETVEEVTDTGFLSTTQTLTVAQMGEDALVQVSCFLYLFNYMFFNVINRSILQGFVIFVPTVEYRNGELQVIEPLKKQRVTNDKSLFPYQVENLFILN
jgi:hypothetical protein